MGALEELEKLGYLFYVVSPNRTSFKSIDEVPDYTVQAVPYFMFILFLEQMFLWMKKKRTMRINDGFGSIAQGLLSEISRILLQGWKIAAYIYIYENYRIADLPWNSLWTWWIAFFATDFIYYWAHRASHEINFLWSAHQVHHSSEDYNLSTALRQSVLQSYFLSFFYLPMALVVPPSAYLVHNTFNLLYQFWIHTEAITSLGPLEYILNTASHHRVHHGRNRYCIDKNYAGTLIIWDRMFGTFEPESEEVVYGLTHPINSFESIYIQLCHSQHIWRTFWETEGLKNKLSVIFKGPGWSPGKPWHGSIEDIPDVKAPAESYDPQIPTFHKLYVFCQILLLIATYKEMVETLQVMPSTVLYGAAIYIVLSFSILGVLLEGRLYASLLECLRCVSYVLMDYYFLPYTRITMLSSLYQFIVVCLLRSAFLASGLFWLQYSIKNVKIKLHSSRKKFD